MSCQKEKDSAIAWKERIEEKILLAWRKEKEKGTC